MDENYSMEEVKIKKGSEWKVKKPLTKRYIVNNGFFSKARDRKEKAIAKKANKIVEINGRLLHLTKGWRKYNV